MKKLRLLVAGLLIVPVFALGAGVVISPVVDAQVDKGIKAAKGSDVPSADDIDGTDDGLVLTVVNLMLYIIGIIAVIMLIFGGIRYATSSGDSAKVTSAKNTIMYALIGLVVAIFAFAIVQWVTRSVTGG